MPRDPFSKVAIGDPLQFTAQWYNAATDAAKYFQRKGNLNANSLIQTRSSTIIRVRNDTESNLDRFAVLGLNDPIFTPDDATVDIYLREVTFKGVVPDINKHKRKYVVTLDPAVQNQVVRAYIAGVCQVLVDQQDEAHEYANIVDTETGHLKSSVHGHARILWREGLQGSGYGYYDSGIQWATVMLGVTGSSGAFGKASGAISARSGATFGTGNVDIYINNGGTEDGPIETVAVLNKGTAISSGKQVAVEWDSMDDAYVGPLECE